MMEGVRGLHRRAHNMGIVGNEHGRLEEMLGCIRNIYELEEGK